MTFESSYPKIENDFFEYVITDNNISFYDGNLETTNFEGYTTKELETIQTNLEKQRKSRSGNQFIKKVNENLPRDYVEEYPENKISYTRSLILQRVVLLNLFLLGFFVVVGVSIALVDRAMGEDILGTVLRDIFQFCKKNTLTAWLNYGIDKDSDALHYIQRCFQIASATNILWTTGEATISAARKIKPCLSSENKNYEPLPSNTV